MRPFVHRLAKPLSLGGSSGAHLVQTPFSSHPGLATQNQGQMLLHRLSRHGDSSLSTQCQCSVILRIKMSLKSLLCFSLCPLPLTLSQSTTVKSLALFSLNLPFWYLHTLMRSLQAFSSPWWTLVILSAFPHDDTTGTAQQTLQCPVLLSLADCTAGSENIL